MMEEKMIRIFPRTDAYGNNEHLITLHGFDEDTERQMGCALESKLDPRGVRAAFRGTRLELYRQPTQDDIKTVEDFARQNGARLEIEIRTDAEFNQLGAERGRQNRR